MFGSTFYILQIQQKNQTVIKEKAENFKSFM